MNANLKQSTLFAKRGLAILVLVSVLGCSGQKGVVRPTAPPMMPRELSKVVLPTYVIEPPDILTIDAISIAPKSPYHMKPLDSLTIQVLGVLPDLPIEGVFPIGPGGLVQLGDPYGAVRVVGMSLDEVKAAIDIHLRKTLKQPSVNVSLATIGDSQQIAGQHVVGPDGTVTLGSYGSVPVVGLTIAEAKIAIETHLSQFLDSPEISVDVFAFNSKVYYIVTQGAGLGDGVYRFPITGNETVLDAISQINGLEQVSSKRIWIARPSRDPCDVQVLPVSWDAITAQASTGSNYQILPGDRVFVAEDKLIAMDTAFGKMIAPLERVMGFTILGTSTVTRLSGRVLSGGGDQRRGGF